MEGRTRVPPSATGTPPNPLAGQPSVLDLLNLERIEENLYRNQIVFERPFRLYGGQVAAQALFAAGCTVPDGRLPHSLHGYFLRGGNTARPTLFRVERDRDGGSFSARRVVAIQNGEVIFNMSASFAAPIGGLERDVDPAPAVLAPDEHPAAEHPYQQSLEVRPAVALDPERVSRQFWVRCTVGVPESPLLHACVLAYMSDISSGMNAIPEYAAASGGSVDHAVWFHRQPALEDWVLLDLVPHVVAGGRGWYAGAFYAQDGTRLATLTQEVLFRQKRATPPEAR
jgi:acyl-CoA thioesterase II